MGWPLGYASVTHCSLMLLLLLLLLVPAVEAAGCCCRHCCVPCVHRFGPRTRLRPRSDPPLPLPNRGRGASNDDGDDDDASVATVLRGGSTGENATVEPPATPWEMQLPMGFVRTRPIAMLWYIPSAVAILSFWTFPLTSLVFHNVAQWASSNTWFPHTPEGVNLQTNVIVREMVSSSLAANRMSHSLSASS